MKSQHPRESKQGKGVFLKEAISKGEMSTLTWAKRPHVCHFWWLHTHSCSDMTTEANSSLLYSSPEPRNTLLVLSSPCNWQGTFSWLLLPVKTDYLRFFCRSAAVDSNHFQKQLLPWVSHRQEWAEMASCWAERRGDEQFSLCGSVAHETSKECVRNSRPRKFASYMR